MEAPPAERLEDLAGHAHAGVDELLEAAADLRRRLQDADAERGACDVSPAEAPLVHLRPHVLALALREVERRLMLVLCYAVPPGAEREAACIRTASWLHGAVVA